MGEEKSIIQKKGEMSQKLPLKCNISVMFGCILYNCVITHIHFWFETDMDIYFFSFFFYDPPYFYFDVVDWTFWDTMNRAQLCSG